MTMNKIFVSIISHNHLNLIQSIKCIHELASHQNIKIVIKTNTNEDKPEEFKKLNIDYIRDQAYVGFGQNNNIVYEYCRDKLGMEKDDYFIVLNPDVYIKAASIGCLISNMFNKDIKISAINLYKDSHYSIYDNSIRKFPDFMTFFKSFVGLGNDSLYDKSTICNIKEIDWAAGSFLAFKSEHYKKLNGFDHGYFMYCEDIDICYRSMLLGERLTYFPSIKGIHFAKHANRRILSKHFYWHLLSTIRFLKVKNA